MKGTTHDDLNRSRGSKIEEANRLLPVVRRADDFVDKSGGSVEEREEFPEDFDTYLHTELNCSRLEYDGGDSRVSGRVFWNRQDDRPKTLPVSDFVSDNVDVFPDSRPKVKDKIRLAIGRIILHPRYGKSLVQFWAATKIEGRTLLTTQNQPFGLGKVGRSAWGLCEYRMKSMEYRFYGDIGESGEEELGLPGRVFLYKLPESAPDVKYYSLKEYPQLHDASLCQVRASWALPVFEQSSQVCVGVLELVSAVDAIADWNDKSFLHYLYDVFQELGLQSSDIHKHYEMKYKDEDKALTTAFHELALVLQSVYEIHKLPLALTWVPCNACDALLPGRLSSNGGEHLQSFKANDDHLVDFLIASAGYHLRKGHVAETVLGSTSMLYCSDVTQFSIAEYPLVPFARQFKLSGCFTVCLRSSYTGEDVYIVEFFLPTSRKDNENTLTQVSTILGTMKEYSKTFKLASGQELGEMLTVGIFDFRNGQRHSYPQMIQASLELLKNGDDGMDVINAEQDDTVATISKGGTTKTQEREHKKTGVRFDISLEDVLRFSAFSRKDAAMRLKVSESTLKRVCRKYGINRWPPRDLNKEEVFPLALPNVEDIGHLDSPEELEVDATKYGPHDVRTEPTDHSWPSSSHLENESLVTIENLQQHFGRRREDVARSLGVSVSTMKRICRQHGIKRWPYRQNGGAMKQLDSDQPSMDAVNNGRSFIGAERNNLDVTFSEERSIITQEGKKGKTGVRIEIPLEVVLQYSNFRLDDAARKLQVSSSTLKRVCRHHGIHRWPPRNIDDVGASQLSHDVPPRSLDKVGASQPSWVELQEGISELTSDRPLASDSRDYRIHLGPPPNRNKVGAPCPSHVEHQDGISELTSDRPSHQASVSRDYHIPLGPPPNRNKVGAPWPSRVEHQDGISQLTSDTPSNQAPLREEGILQLAFDRPSNQVLDSVAHVKQRDTAVQDTKMVTVRAKYVNGFTIKFPLPLCSGLEELHRQVDKRLNLKAEAYDIVYEDEDRESILMACDEDLQLCINTSRASGKNSIVVVLEPKKLM